MSHRNRLQFFLVKRLAIPNRTAHELIQNGSICINDVVTTNNVVITATDKIVYHQELLQEAKQLIYIAFYKPRGIETTLNPNITQNLKTVLPFQHEVFPVGRLDKDSEGLLLLTNDGQLFNKVIDSKEHIEKEYWVTVDRPIDSAFIQAMASGIEIMGKTTLPCTVIPVDEYSFRIILVQGLNRQIRRMCYKLNYQVLRLIRLRIGNINLDTLQPLEYKYLDKLSF